MTSLPTTSSPARPAPQDTATAQLDLSVIIVNYNVREFLEQALRSVQRAADGLSLEIFVVDNNSVDGSVEMVREAFPEVRLIANEENVGFSKANNQAIRKARGRYLLILNPDTIVKEDTLVTLVRFMEAHPEAGAVGCRILNPDGTFALESRRAFPTPRVAFFRMVGLSRIFPKSRLFGRYNLTFLPADEVNEVDALSGSCMLVRRAALERSQAEDAARRAEGTPSNGAARPTAASGGTGAGLFDESFFMYGEDLDWCYRIQQAGWKIYYTPETEIIHYKGESTKRGELRYVRLFYGAMLRFAQKHFRNRHSGLFALLLRLGVVLRATLTLLGHTFRRISAPLFDFLVLLLAVEGTGLWRSAQTDVIFPPPFYQYVAPAYALAMVLGVALVGGYRWNRRFRITPVWLGVTLGLLVVSTIMFFVRDIAYSRVVVLAASVIGALLVSGVRALRRSRQQGLRKALLVGDAAEALRLRAMISRHPEPPFRLVGYLVADGVPEAETPEDLPRLGTLRHLRDLVRLRGIDDVVFAAEDVTNRTIFQLVQQVRDLPVQARILAAGREHIIGKASIDDLSTPMLIAAEKAIGLPRSRFARRLFELPMALLWLLLHPLIGLMARFGGAGLFWRRLATCTRQMPAVLRGKRALVGYHPRDSFIPPPEWELLPGVFAVTDTLQTAFLTREEIGQAYWFYVRNQSAFLDWTIMARSVRRLRR